MARRRVGFLLLVLVVIVAGVVLGAQFFRPYVFKGVVLQSPQPAPDFELTGAGGQRVKLSDFRGKIVLLFFGYTFCPDVCPTTMLELKKAMDILGPEKASKVQVIMISVDPERDTPDRVDAYAKNFNPNFIGLTGTPDEIAEVATMYGIYYEKEEGTAATGYLVSHTATVTVVDQEGYVRLLFRYGMPPEEIASDLAYMLK